MKIIEDQRIKVISPFDSPFVSFEGEEEAFKLSEVKEWQPPKLELVFEKNGQQISGFLEGEEGNMGIGTHLRNYKKEFEEKLRGSTWLQILEYNFKFHDASRIPDSGIVR